MEQAGRAERPERLLGGLLLLGAAWLLLGLLVWAAQVLGGGFGWIPWMPLAVLALAVPLAQARAGLLLVRPEPGSGAGGALGLAAGLGAALLPPALTPGLGVLQPPLGQLPSVLTVVGAMGAVALLARRHGLRPNRLATPPASLVASATALALVWLGLALDQGALVALVPAVTGAVVVVLAALTGPPGYRGGLLLGWWWGLVATGGSLLVAGLYLGIVYGQAWAGLVVLGVAVALVAALVALRSVPPGA